MKLLLPASSRTRFVDFLCPPQIELSFFSPSQFTTLIMYSLAAGHHFHSGRSRRSTIGRVGQHVRTQQQQTRPQGETTRSQRSWRVQQWVYYSFLIIFLHRRTIRLSRRGAESSGKIKDGGGANDLVQNRYNDRCRSGNSAKFAAGRAYKRLISRRGREALSSVRKTRCKSMVYIKEGEKDIRPFFPSIFSSHSGV